jgi:hypothetical protein
VCVLENHARNSLFHTLDSKLTICWHDESAAGMLENPKSIAAGLKHGLTTCLQTFSSELTVHGAVWFDTAQRRA